MIDQESISAYAKVRADKGELHWMVTRAADDNKSTKLAASGESGFNAFMDALKANDPGIYCGVFRIRAVDNRGSVQSVRVKFLRIFVVSASLGMMKRAKSAQVKPDFDKFFCNTHLNLDVDDISTLSKLEIARSLLRAGGAHTPNSFEFSGNDPTTDDDIIPIVQGQAVAAGSVPGISKNASPASPPSSPTSTEAKKKQEEEEKKKEDAAAAAAKKEETAAAAKKEQEENKTPGKMTPSEAWTKVMGDADDLNWVLLTYTGRDVNTAEVFASGYKGLDEFKAAIDDDHVLFGGLRVTAIDDRGSVKSVRSKFVFVQFTSTNVKPVVRAHAGTARGEFQKIVHGTHVSMNINAPEELQTKVLEEKLLSSCGAHKPNRFDFGSKKRTPADLVASDTTATSSTAAAASS